MKFKIDLDIEFENNQKTLAFFKSIKPELSDFERSKTTVSKNKNNLKFEIMATDKTAARASLNTIMKPLILFNELEGIKK
jgi:tRNA threonylcarbamoyladenosine modification (KEOPS) complex  Pcc1 subunit